LAGVLLEFIKSGGGHPGVGEVNNEFVPGQLGNDATADHIKGADVGVRDKAPDLYLRRLFEGVDPDEHLDAWIPVGGVGVVRTGMAMSMAHRASELPHRMRID
jgi:hypothetical protein